MSWFCAALLSLVSGCGRSEVATPNPISTATRQQPSIEPANVAAEGAESKPHSKRRTLAPVEVDSGSPAGTVVVKSPAEQLNSVREALKPFQILLGRWNGLSQKAISDHPEWAYDWVTDPQFPRLKVTSEKLPYLREGRLAYLPDLDQFELKATDAEGVERIMRGTFTEPIRDVAGDGKKLQRTYKLQLTESAADPAGEQWRITLNQQENNRYILEIDRKRGSSPFSRVDTVHTQREGTSFALSETDYGDKTCIISQGLGTISVSYQGQSFMVCCSGCKAAFDDDPQKWIAKWEEKKKMQK